MDISGVIQLIASAAEAFVALTAVRIAIQKKKAYGWFIALTFTLFVLFNWTRWYSSLPAPRCSGQWS